MSKNWRWHRVSWAVYQPEPCPVCGKVIRRMRKHLNHFHPEWQNASPS